MPSAKKIDETLTTEETPFTEKVSSFAHDAVDQATERMGSAEESIRATANETAEAIADKKETAAMEIGTLSNQARMVVVQNPLLSAAVAFGAGLLVTSLLSNRS